MEYEVRFYYAKNDLDKLINKLREYSELNEGYRTYEKTIQYNHSDSRYNFYSKEIDGRFRVRVSSNDIESKCKLSWKRRLNNTSLTEVNKEEEKEVSIPYQDYDNFIFILDKVLHFEVVESYERYRTIFFNKDIEISIDEYPFGIALEIENKSIEKDPIDNVKKWTNKLGLDIKDSYKLSWDDKYIELCKKEGKQVYSEVTFDKDMPSVK